MFRKRINKVRRKFAFEGQEGQQDKEIIETIESVVIHNSESPFTVFFFIESIGGGGQITKYAMEKVEFTPQAMEMAQTVEVKVGFVNVVFKEHTIVSASIDGNNIVTVY